VLHLGNLQTFTLQDNCCQSCLLWQSFLTTIDQSTLGAHMQGMVDCGGDVTLTPDEFLSAAQQCMAIEKAVQRQELGPEIVRELEALSVGLSRSMVRGGALSCWWPEGALPRQLLL
jgi:hypothetical protein